MKYYYLIIENKQGFTIEEAYYNDNICYYQKKYNAINIFIRDTKEEAQKEIEELENLKKMEG